MSKYCYNYDSGEYEYIDRDGYSETQGNYVYNIIGMTANIFAKMKKKATTKKSNSNHKKRMQNSHTLF